MKKRETTEKPKTQASCPESNEPDGPLFFDSPNWDAPVHCPACADPERTGRMSVQQFKAPDWNRPFGPQKQWGELVSSITEISNLIEQTAKVFRESIPESEKEVISIEQSTGLLEMHIRGGVRRHTDLDMWVTERTLPLTMRIIYSVRAFKPQLESLASQQEAEDLYHNVMNALRYVHEPKEPDVEGHISKTSGDDVLPGSEVRSPAIKAKNVFRRFSYVFVGDEPRERHGTYIGEILATLRNLREIKRDDSISDNLSTPQKNGGQDETNNIAIDDMELTIIAELAEGSDKTFSQVKIEALTSIKRGTIKDKLLRLEKIGLIHRPLGERKGYQITGKGREIAKRNE